MDNEKLPTGTPVQIISTGQLGTVVEAADRKGRVRVAVGSIEMVVSISDIRRRALSKESIGAAKYSSRRKRGKSLARTRKIDLHGKTVEEALGIIEEAINRAVLEGVDEIEIVHGIGTGRVKNATRNYLATLESFVTFAAHISNPGITIARIKRG